MSIVVIRDTDSGNRCVVYSEKNIYNVNMTKKTSTLCFYLALPQLLYIHTDVYIHVPNCYWEITHTQSNWCCVMFPTAHSPSIIWRWLPQLVALNFKGVSPRAHRIWLRPGCITKAGTFYPRRVFEQLNPGIWRDVWGRERVVVQDTYMWYTLLYFKVKHYRYTRKL
jgi:hypothetical protein